MILSNNPETFISIGINRAERKYISRWINFRRTKRYENCYAFWNDEGSKMYYSYPRHPFLKKINRDKYSLINLPNGGVIYDPK